MPEARKSTAARREGRGVGRELAEDFVAVRRFPVAALTAELPAAVEGQLHAGGDGDEEWHHRQLVLGDLIDEDNGDAGLVIDHAAPKIDAVVVEPRRDHLEGADMAGGDVRAGIGAPAPPFSGEPASRVMERNVMRGLRPARPSGASARAARRN